jgi:HAD superfamily hydrolase (TIGR01509 family)
VNRTERLWGMNGSCLVLDFDGTILDTEEPQFVAWAELWNESGHELSVADWQEHIGRLDTFDPAAELASRTGRAIDPARHVERRRRRAELQALTGMRAGVAEWLSDAESLGIPVGIASSSPTEWVEPHLDRLGLTSRFACIVCSNEDIAPKPAPDSYQLACTLMDAEPQLSVAVEDSPHGVRAAVSAGIFVLGVPHDLTRNLDFSAADVVLQELSEMKLSDAIAAAVRRSGSL